MCDLLFNHFVFDAFQHHSQVDVIYTDFKKTFDTVDHGVLIQILGAFGFYITLLSWFKSYLKNIYQWVKLINTKPTVSLASYGVTQDGHILSILFPLFVNNAYKILYHSRFLCFPDNVKLFIQIILNCQTTSNHWSDLY